MMDAAGQPAGLVLATLGSVGVGVAVLAESTSAAAFDRLAEIAPLTAVLLAGLWLLFRAYRELVDRLDKSNRETIERLVTVINANTHAHAENGVAVREVATQLREMRGELAEHGSRIDRLEHGRASPP